MNLLQKVAYAKRPTETVVGVLGALTSYPALVDQGLDPVVALLVAVIVAVVPTGISGLVDKLRSTAEALDWRQVIRALADEAEASGKLTADQADDLRRLVTAWEGVSSTSAKAVVKTHGR